MNLLCRLFPLLALSACLADAPTFDLTMHGTIADVAAAIAAQGKTLVVVDHRAAGESVGVAMRGVSAEQAVAELAKVKDLAAQPLPAGTGWLLYWAGQGRGIMPVSTLIPLHNVRARDVAGWFGKPWIEQRGGQMVTVQPDPNGGSGPLLLTAPAGISVLVGNDPINALVVTGQPRAVEALKATVAMLDVAPARLRIDVQVYDLALAELDALGQGWDAKGGKNAPLTLEGLKPEVLRDIAAKGRLLGRAHLDTFNDQMARMAFTTTVAASGTGAPPADAKPATPPAEGWPLSYDVLLRPRLTGSPAQPQVTVSLNVQASRVRSVLTDPVKGIWPLTTSTQLTTQIRLNAGATVGLLGPDFRQVAPDEPGRDRAQLVLLTPTVLDPSEATMVSAPDVAPVAGLAAPPPAQGAVKPAALPNLANYRIVRADDQIQGRVPLRYLKAKALAELMGARTVVEGTGDQAKLVGPAPVEGAYLAADTWQLTPRPLAWEPGQEPAAPLHVPHGILEVTAHEPTNSLVHRSQFAWADWLSNLAGFFDHPGAGVDLEVEWLRLTPAEADQLTWRVGGPGRPGVPGPGYVRYTCLDQVALDEQLKRWDCPTLGPSVLATEQGRPAAVTIDRSKPHTTHATVLAGTWPADNAEVTIGLWVQSGNSDAPVACTVRRNQSLLIRSGEFDLAMTDRLLGNPVDGPKNEQSQLILVLTPLKSAR